MLNENGNHMSTPNHIRNDCEYGPNGDKDPLAVN